LTNQWPQTLKLVLELDAGRTVFISQWLPFYGVDLGQGFG